MLRKLFITISVLAVVLMAGPSVVSVSSVNATKPSTNQKLVMMQQEITGLNKKVDVLSTQLNKHIDASKRWVTVANIKGGTESSTSTPISFTGGKLRLTYNIESTETLTAASSSLGFYASVSFNVNGQEYREPAILTISHPTKKTAQITLPLVKGAKYYLNVESANCEWTLLVEELR